MQPLVYNNSVRTPTVHNFDHRGLGLAVTVIELDEEGG
jgi:hypothetical protein